MWKFSIVSYGEVDLWAFGDPPTWMPHINVGKLPKLLNSCYWSLEVNELKISEKLKYRNITWKSRWAQETPKFCYQK